jgi:hypothetical protein
MLASTSHLPSEAQDVDVSNEEGEQFKRMETTTSSTASPEVHSVDTSTKEEGGLFKRMETTASPLDSKVHDVDASTDEGELFKRMETTTYTTINSPLDSEVHKRGITSSESPDCRFPGQEKKERRSVTWQVADNAPERTGPWKAPKRKKKSRFGTFLRKRETVVLTTKNRNVEPQKLPTDARSSETTDRPSDAVPAEPARMQSKESPPVTRRSSLLEAIFPSSDSPPSPPARRQSKESPTVTRRRSILEAIFPSSDSPPSPPARRESNESPTVTRRRSILEAIFPSSDSPPSPPARRQSKESPTVTRRISILEAIFPSSDSSPSPPARSRQSKESPTVTRGRSLFDAVLPTRDSVPAQPSRRQSNENETCRKLSPTSVFSSNREISSSETLERSSGEAYAAPTPLPERQSSNNETISMPLEATLSDKSNESPGSFSAGEGEGFNNPDDDIDLDNYPDGDSEPDADSKPVRLSEECRRSSFLERMLFSGSSTELVTFEKSDSAPALPTCRKQWSFLEFSKRSNATSDSLSVRKSEKNPVFSKNLSRKSRRPLFLERMLSAGKSSELTVFERSLSSTSIDITESTNN